MQVAQHGTEGTVIWRACESREKQQQNEVSRGSTKLDIVWHSPAPQAETENLIQKQELPLMPLLSSQSRDFSGRKADPVTIIYHHANIFLLVFCWCNTSHMCLEPGEKSYQQDQGRLRLIWFHVDKLEQSVLKLILKL